MVDWFFGSCPSQHLDPSTGAGLFGCGQTDAIASKAGFDLMTCDQPIGRDNLPTKNQHSGGMKEKNGEIMKGKVKKQIYNCDILK